MVKALQAMKKSDTEPLEDTYNTVISAFAQQAFTTRMMTYFNEVNFLLMLLLLLLLLLFVVVVADVAVGVAVVTVCCCWLWLWLLTRFVSVCR